MLIRKADGQNLFLSGAMLFILSWASGNIQAAEAMTVAWTKNNVSDKFEVILDDKATGRLVFFFAFHANLKQTKGGNNLDNVMNKGAGQCDLVKGRGHCSGFDTNEKDGDSYKVGWAGECYPVVGAEGKSVGHCAGGWSVLPGTGTGRFDGLSGGGTWRGHDLPNGEFFVEVTATLEK